MEPVDSPSWRSARSEERKRYYTRLGELIQIEMRDALRRGVDRHGRRMRRRKYRRSDGASGPPLIPHRADSRTWRLLTFSASPRGVRMWWRASGRVSWTTILTYHAEGAGRLPVRDVMGLARRWLNRAVEAARLWWSNLHPWDRWGGPPVAPAPAFAVPTPRRFPPTPPPVAARDRVVRPRPSSN